MNNPIKVLVVDDDLKSNRELFMSFLKRHEFLVSFAETKKEFLEASHIEDFDVVLLDINLDHWKVSYEAALQAIGDKAPVVLTSTAFKESHTTKKLQEGKWSHPEVNIIQVFDMRLLTLGAEVGKTSETSANTFSEILIALVPPKQTNQLKSDQEIVLLHLSDPQYGDSGTSEWSLLLEQQLGDYLKEEGLEPDVLLVTGDVAYSGKREEYKIATRDLKKLLKGLGLENSQNSIVLVPGNHDVDFRASSVPTLMCEFSNKINITQNTALEGGNSLYGMNAFRLFAFELTGDINWVKSETLSWINNKLNHFGIRFIQLNTAHNISTTNINIPSINQDTIEQLTKDISNVKDLFTITISHHGPSEHTGSGEDNLEVDWAKLGQLFRVSKTQLWLHGHGHGRVTVAQSIARSENTFNISNLYKLQPNEIVRIMAPSSHLSEEKRAENESRGFNIVKLKKLAGSTKPIINRVEITHYKINEEGINEIPDKTVTFSPRRSGVNYT